MWVILSRSATISVVPAPLTTCSMHTSNQQLQLLLLQACGKIACLVNKENQKAFCFPFGKYSLTL